MTVVRVAFECAAAGERPEAFYEDICSLLLGPDCRYQQTPPELFPIGRMGVDGVHYGYVVHAPELEREDYPVGELCPMDSDGVFLVGPDTPSAFENLISCNLSLWAAKDYDFDPNDSLKPDAEELARYRIRIESISDALGIQPDASKAPRRYGPDGEGFPVTPEVPAGWRHVASSDGIGVLAPLHFFEPREFAHLNPYRDPTAFLTAGRDALAAAYPATALLHLREGYWHHWVDPDLGTQLTTAMGECYRGLERPTLAEVLEASREQIA